MIFNHFINTVLAPTDAAGHIAGILTIGNGQVAPVVDQIEVTGSVVIGTGIDPTYHNVILSDIYRVQQTESEEDGIWVIDSRTLGNGLSFNLSDFTFNTSPIVGEDSEVTYRFNSGASLAQFTLSASAGSTKESVAILEKVTATSSAVKVEKGSAEGEYILL